MPRFLILVTLVLAGIASASVVPATTPADSSIEQRATNASFDLFAKIADEAKPPLPSITPTPARPPVTQPPVKRRDSYAIAYESAQSSGRLFLFLTMPGCEPCKVALRQFESLATQSGGACVVLDLGSDEANVRANAEPHNGQLAFPQIIRYRLVAGEWLKSTVIGNKPDEIFNLMRGDHVAVSEDNTPLLPSTIVRVASHQKPCPGGCKNCPADCAANGCVNCANGSTGSSGESSGYVRGQPLRNAARWTLEHKPVRKTIKGALRVTAWCVTHPCGGFFRRGCR